MELVLVAVATCAQSTLIDVLAKMRQPLDGLHVSAWGTRAHTVPRIWDGVEVVYVVRSEGSPERLQHAAALAERTCSAAAMVAKAANLRTTLIQVKQVEPAVTRPLRQRILRPHQSLEELVVPGEEGDESAWFGALRGDLLIGSAGIFPEQSPDIDVPGSWRLRAMATDEEARGMGVGNMLLDSCLSHAKGRDARLVWCSARTPVLGFYEARGFVAVSDEYEPDGLGPHVRMALRLS